MHAVLTTGHRYRHVVFTASTKRPLNLGGPGSGLASRSPATWHARSHPTEASDTLPEHPHDEEEVFLAWLFAQGALKVRDYRTTPLRRRLPACLRALRAQNLAHARQLLRRNDQLVPVALDTLLLGVTEFFRDAAVFACLDHEFERFSNSAAARPLRVWSAACSAGAELYSVAILLAERGLLHGSDLLGTDCRPDAIARASAGVYPTSAFRDAPGPHVARHVLAEAGCCRVAPDLCRRVTWRTGDVLTDVEPGPWDVVLCRNMAMYLQPAAAEGLWRKLAAVVRPGGLLVVGKAERPGGASIALAQVGPCVYRRYGEL